MSLAFGRYSEFRVLGKNTEGVQKRGYSGRFGDYSEGRCVGRDFGTTTSRTPTGLGMVPIMQRRLRCTVRPPVPSRMVDRGETGQDVENGRVSIRVHHERIERDASRRAACINISRIAHPTSVSTWKRAGRSAESGSEFSWIWTSYNLASPLRETSDLSPIRVFSLICI